MAKISSKIRKSFANLLRSFNRQKIDHEALFYDNGEAFGFGRENEEEYEDLPPAYEMNLPSYEDVINQIASQENPHLPTYEKTLEETLEQEGIPDEEIFFGFDPSTDPRNAKAINLLGIFTRKKSRAKPILKLKLNPLSIIFFIRFNSKFLRANFVEFFHLINHHRVKKIKCALKIFDKFKRRILRQNQIIGFINVVFLIDNNDWLSLPS